MNKSKFAKFRKSAIAALCAVAVTCTGLAAACANNGSTGGDDSDSSTPRKEDTQLLKNGNFEYFNVPEKAVHLIKNVSSWSRSGDSSGAMSGIINTSEKAWEKMTDTGLKATLDANNDLKPGDSNYKDKHVDYNGMDSGDILYIEPYAASLETNIGDDEYGYAKDGVILSGGKQEQRTYWQFLGIKREGNEDDGYTYSFKGETVYLNEDDGDYYFDEDFTLPVRNAIIENPETHYGTLEEGETYRVGDEEYKLLVDEDGNYYFDIDGDDEIDTLKDESVGNVLMIHNYPTSTSNKYNGIEQHYTSNSITLEANTAAEISVWVKTSALKFDRGYLLNNDPVIGGTQQDRGAYIEVTQSVAGHSVDSFMIKAINTEKILADNPELDKNNGWLQYTIYVNACDFANSTITINLGLGGKNTDEKITGYAFFDDVEVKKFIDITESSYNEDIAGLIFDEDNSGENISYCSLLSEADEKIFYADKTTIYEEGQNDERFSTRFHYLIDLASEQFNDISNKKAITFNTLNVSTALTTSESSMGKIYASALENKAHVSGVTKGDDSSEYLLPDSLKDRGGRPTFNDLIGIYDSSKIFAAQDFTGTDDSGHGLDIRDLSGRLNPSLTGEKGLAALKDFSGAHNSTGSYNGSMLLTLSAYGAAYTTTVESETLFKVDGTKNGENNYKIISFWVKTSDMNGSTAATIRIKDVADDENYKIITVDSTKIKTDIGDEKDIYSGWVQCFFFVGNETDTDKTFKIEFSFGNTNIESASYNSFNYGWAAMANIQSLDVTEDVYKIVSEGTYAKTLTFGEEDSKTHTPFDEATKMSNVKKEVGTPTKYDGVNGYSSHVTDKEFSDDYDRKNNNSGIAGLINREGFENETYKEDLRNEILSSFIAGATSWNEVFGEQCYQPLIIVNNLRKYYEKATADPEYIEQHIEEFFIFEDGVYKAATEYEEGKTYYSLRQVMNYGYIANSNTTISANSFKAVSVKVMVTGSATAWIYLVDASSNEAMTFDIPEYTYYYDEEGNVLKEEYNDEWELGSTEHKEAIAYKLREDGLYEDENGKVYANLANLTKRFKYPKFEHNTFYLDENGENYVRYDDLEDGVTYYNEDGKIASHYLCVDTQRIYEYDAENETYYYLVEGKRSVSVKDFDHDYARPYSLDREPSEYEYAVKVENTGTDENNRPKWVTVNFFIQTGNEAKAYRLELWSGERGERGCTDETESVDKGAVAFDIADSGITGSNASTVISEKESVIKEIYIDLITAEDPSLLEDEENLKENNIFELNINELKAIAEDLGIEESKVEEKLKEAGLENIVAEYYTFSWYDSAQFVPFNSEIAEAGQTGYNYTATSESETLVYFKMFDSTDNSYNVYVDYSAIDQTVSINNATNDSDDNHNHDDDDTDGQSGWLLITSIILFAVIIFVLIALLLRNLWKNYSKKRTQKQMQKNNYKQRERYIRRYGLVKTAPVEENDEEVPAESDEAPSTEETPVEGPAEEVTTEETPVEEAPAESDETSSTEETPAEEAKTEETPVETPVDETPTAETPAEDDKKDE